MTKLVPAVLTAGLALGLLPGSAMAQTASNQRFTIIRAGTGPALVVAHGVINAVGTETDNAGQVPPGHPFDSTSTFPQGELFTTITYDGPPNVTFNPTTCETRVELTDHFVVTGGTRNYAAANGSGTDTVHITEIAGRDSTGSCLGPKSPPIFELTVIQSTGNITLT
jgi:hypothetical protein